MELYNNLPLYSMQINEDELNMYMISLVNSPAVDKDFLKFNGVKRYTYSSDGAERVVTGVALRADYPIYRNTPDGEFYITFGKDTIKELVKLYFSKGFNKNFNLEHKFDLENGDVTLYESYIIDESKGILPNEVIGAKNGDWVISLQIHNDKLWEDVKNGRFNGFSIECVTNIVDANKKQLEDIESNEEIEFYKNFYKELCTVK